MYIYIYIYIYRKRERERERERAQKLSKTCRQEAMRLHDHWEWHSKSIPDPTMTFLRPKPA